jgi:hypothetical protein
MLQEVTAPETQVLQHDLGSFLALQDLARSLDVSDTTEYWKCAPYLVNFMDEYDPKRRFIETVEGTQSPAKILQALCADTGILLSREDVSSHRQLDPCNARLRNLVVAMLDSEAWRLLWVPPSWHYYEPEGEFSQPACKALTKRLIFSSWQVVPKVVAAFLSYEAERRMLGIGPSGEPGSQAPEARRRRGALLRFGVIADRPTGMPVLSLLYPSFVLAREVDPRQWATAGPVSKLPKLQEILDRATVTCADLLKDLTAGAPAEGDVDERWYWAAPIMLDLRGDAPAAKAWFGQANLAGQWRGGEPASGTAADEDDDGEGEDAWAAHVRAARELANKPVALKRPPADLAAVLALNAVAGPAVTALRAIARVAGGLQRVTDKSLRNQAGQVAEGFRSLFNQPDVAAMLRRLNNEEPYWQRVLEYCSRGGLQSVLDEYAHVLVEYLGVSGRPVEQIQREVSAAIQDALTLRAATVAADLVTVDRGTQAITIDDKIRFRTRFAVRYGGRSQEEPQTVQRQGDILKAFNSPFWPFLLCSTSVGQEGLDFHLYCHAVVHWNLPSNPVDLEQREGRVHRYKGQAVRKNIARDFSIKASYSTSGPSSDSWRQLFDAGRDARALELSDLVPFWVYTPEGGARIERHLPMILLSKEVEQAEGLRRSLAVYRMAFGQSRQDDLVQFLQQYLTTEQINAAVTELRIDLTPPPSPDRHKSGVLQAPGELAGDGQATETDLVRFGLGDFEELLDAFSAITRAPVVLSVETVEQLLIDFSALRGHEQNG